MFHQQLGPIDIDCDAPPYYIVQACSQVGFQSAEDVRWCRANAASERKGNWLNLFKAPALGALLGVSPPDRETCSCGQALPGLEMYTFLLARGASEAYFLEQCSRCHTIYWKDA